MQYTKLIRIAVVSVALTAACNTREPTQDPAGEEAARAESAAADLQRKRTEETAEMEEKVAELERRWMDMEGKIAGKAVKASTALRAEVKEDIKNVREAIADLRTTTPENWWDRHERAIERTAGDIEADVRRFAKGRADSPTTTTPEPAPSAAPFESQRDQFVTRLQARVDRMEGQLKNVTARGTKETELEDTRARVNKLKDDVDRLRKASADDWWDASSTRVRDYIERLEDSIERLDNDKT